MNTPRFTILTPTYNRAHTLPALKASLDAQDFRDFEWLVVDDGSTDDTLALLRAWQDGSDFPLRWLCGPNGGKHRALNRGIPEARGAWIFIVDSDDRLPPGALAKAAAAADIADADPKLGGIMGLRHDGAGRLIGEPLPAGLRQRDAAALTFVDGLRGDKAELFKAEVLRKFPFPEFEGEKFITECVVWFRIAAAGYELFLLPEPIYVCDYRPDGLSASSLRLRRANPRGTLLFYAEELALPYPLLSLAREALNYARFEPGCDRAYARERWTALPARAKFLVTALRPAAALARLADGLR